MSVTANVKLKPGLQTSFNSGARIKDNFSNGNQSNRTTTVRNNTASSAAKNLANMNLVSGDWSSNTGSILNTKPMNSGTTNHSSSSSSHTTTAKYKDPKYVSSGYANKKAAFNQMMRQSFTSQIGSFFGGRPELQSGYSGRALQRMQNNVYGQLNAQQMHNEPKTSTLQDITNTLATGVAIGKSAVGLFNEGKDLWDSIKGSSSNSTASSNLGDLANTVSLTDTATQAFSRMDNAETSAQLESAINVAENEAKALDAEQKSAESSLNNLKGQTEGLKNNSETANTNYQNNINACKTKSDQIANLSKSIKALDTSINSLRAQLEKAPSEEKAAISKQLNAKEAQLNKLKEEHQKASDELAELQEQTPTLKAAMDDAKEAYDKNLTDIKTTINKINTMVQTGLKYEKELPKQQNRLNKMRDQENKELNKLNSKVGTKAAQSTESKEEGKMKKAARQDAKLDKLEARQTQLQDVIDIRNLPKGQIIGANEFQCDQNKGIYAVNGEKVSKEVYEELMQKAQSSED